MKSNFLLKSLMILLLGTISFSVVACAENGDDDLIPPAEENGLELEQDEETEESEESDAETTEQE